jgi:hypothetical protein
MESPGRLRQFLHGDSFSTDGKIFPYGIFIPEKLVAAMPLTPTGLRPEEEGRPKKTQKRRFAPQAKS